jgi:predicted amidohydrolase
MTPPPPPPFRVAAIQFDPTMGAKSANVDALLGLCEAAAAGGARLIVTPEMATVGYCWRDRAEVAPEVEPIPGPTTDRFAAFAARTGAHVVLGLAEVAPDTGVYYNSAPLIGPAGVLGVYRKTHAFIADPKWAKDGDLGLPVWETALGRIAIVICMDAAYPETTRIPALAGADVVCFPTNWLGEKAPSPSWLARAAESGLYLIAANRSGLERGVRFDGGSCVVDPDGAVQSWRDSGDGVVFGEVDPARARAKRPDPACPLDLLAARRPDAYGDLNLNAYLWDARAFHGLYGIRPLPEGRRSRTAVLQVDPVPGDPAANLAAIEAALDTEPAIELLVAPELALCGEPTDAIAAAAVAEPVDGPSVARLAEIARERGCWVVAGLVERGGERLFNTAVLVGPEGLAGRYRKLHLADADRSWAEPGDLGLETFDTPLGRIGLLIGADLLLPEAMRSLALAGADLVACPARLAWPPVRPWGATAVPMDPGVEAGPTADHFHLGRERARENATWLLYANAPACGGWSACFGPDPEHPPRVEALVPSAAAGIATLEIDTGEPDPATPTTTNPCRAKPLLRMRVPFWYDPLVTPVTETAAGHALAGLPRARDGARPGGEPILL